MQERICEDLPGVPGLFRLKQQGRVFQQPLLFWRIHLSKDDRMRLVLHCPPETKSSSFVELSAFSLPGLNLAWFHPSYIHIPKGTIPYSPQAFILCVPHTSCTHHHPHTVYLRAFPIVFILLYNTHFPISAFLDPTFSSRPLPGYLWMKPFLISRLILTHLPTYKLEVLLLIWSLLLIDMVYLSGLILCLYHPTRHRGAFSASLCLVPCPRMCCRSLNTLSAGFLVCQLPFGFSQWETPAGRSGCREESPSLSLPV